jgi:hypothetical protein
VPENAIPTAIVDPTELVLAIDERVRSLPPGCDPARLFGVRLRPNQHDDADFVLIPLWSGVAREIPAWVRPPRGVVGIALQTGGWAAPMEDDGSVHGRPSEHPERRRIHHVTLIHGGGEDISVLRYEGDGDPLVLEGAIGYVHELLLTCWARRAR